MELTDRFWSKVDRSGGEDACWVWLGYKMGAGYGGFFIGLSRRPKKQEYAHRVSYELLVGPIPEGLHLDHLCRNHPCVNPRHLEPVTHRENCLRGTSPAANNAKKTHCAYGHAFTPENTKVANNGSRVCLECRRILDELAITRRTHCKQGHAFTPENTRFEKTGKKRCRACDQLRVGRRTHCLRGHKFTEKNTGRSRDGARWCKECKRLYDAKRWGARMRKEQI